MEYLVALLLAAEIVYFVVCAFRLRKTGRTGRLAAGVAALCAASAASAETAPNVALSELGTAVKVAAAPQFAPSQISRVKPVQT